MVDKEVPLIKAKKIPHNRVLKVNLECYIQNEAI